MKWNIKYIQHDYYKTNFYHIEHNKDGYLSQFLNIIQNHLYVLIKDNSLNIRYILQIYYKLYNFQYFLQHIYYLLINKYLNIQYKLFVYPNQYYILHNFQFMVQHINHLLTYNYHHKLHMQLHRQQLNNFLINLIRIYYFNP